MDKKYYEQYSRLRQQVRNISIPAHPLCGGCRRAIYVYGELSYNNRLEELVKLAERVEELEKHCNKARADCIFLSKEKNKQEGK